MCDVFSDELVFIIFSKQYFVKKSWYANNATFLAPIALISIALAIHSIALTW